MPAGAAMAVAESVGDSGSDGVAEPLQALALVLPQERGGQVEGTEESGSDVDFLAGVGIGAAAAATAGGPLAQDAQPRQVDPQPHPVGRPRAGGKVRAVSFGKVGERTAMQHHALAAYMREAKAQKKWRHCLTEQASTVTEAVSRVAEGSRGGLSLEVRLPRACGGRSRVCGGLELVDRSSASSCRYLSASESVRLAYHDLSRRNDLARAFKVGHSVVLYTRAAVARVYLQEQQKLCDALARASATSHEGRLSFIAVALAFDETTERLCLPMAQDSAEGPNPHLSSKPLRGTSWFRLGHGRMGGRRTLLASLVASH